MPNVFMPNTKAVIQETIYLTRPYAGPIPKEYKIAVVTCPQRHFPMNMENADEVAAYTFYYAVYEYKTSITNDLMEYVFVGMDHDG